MIQKRSGQKRLRKNSGRRKLIKRIVESCGPDEHHGKKKHYVLSPESEELSNEQSDDDYLFEGISDTDFSDVKELDVDDARSETSFSRVLIH